MKAAELHETLRPCMAAWPQTWPSYAEAGLFQLLGSSVPCSRSGHRVILRLCHFWNKIGIQPPSCRWDLRSLSPVSATLRLRYFRLLSASRRVVLVRVLLSSQGVPISPCNQCQRMGRYRCCNSRKLPCNY